MFAEAGATGDRCAALVFTWGEAGVGAELAGGGEAVEGWKFRQKESGGESADAGNADKEGSVVFEVGIGRDDGVHVCFDIA